LVAMINFFSSRKKSKDAGDPDFVPSINPKTASKKPGSGEAANAQSVARCKHAKQRPTLQSKKS